MDDLIGCSSHMCLIQKPKGVGTNGPCLCKAHKLRLKLTWQDVRIKLLEDDYINIVGKFDNCRGCIAWTLEKLGKNPSKQPDDDQREWHEWLIEELQKEVEDKDG